MDCFEEQTLFLSVFTYCQKRGKML